MGCLLWTESVFPEELNAIMEYAIAQGRVAQNRSESLLGLPIEGWQHLEALQHFVYEVRPRFCRYVGSVPKSPLPMKTALRLPSGTPATRP